MRLSVYSVKDALLQTSSNVNSPSAAGNRYFWGMSARVNLVEMFNCIVDTVEDSSSVRSYRKFLIANFCYKYIHKTIKLTEHYNT